jgi:hypothetical protein
MKNNINLVELKAEVAQYPEIQGKLADITENSTPEELQAAQMATWDMAYVYAYKAACLGDFLGSFGARLVGSEVQTQGLGLNASLWMSSAETGKMLFHTVGKGQDQKKILLIPGEKVWMHVQMQEGKVIKARKATAEDFEKAKPFALTNANAAQQLWSRIGVLHAEWTRRADEGGTFVAALPALPGAEKAKAKNNKRPRNRGRSKGNR